MPSKVFRDPLYNYVSIDVSQDGWLLDAINSREFQRLRRIHQLGVSNFTCPGADHNRLCHSLGVLHLMQMVLDHLSQEHEEREFDQAKPILLAAALVHDVGHGPFSHLFEPCLGIDHEEWSQKIILDESTEIHSALRRCNKNLPQDVVDLINPNNQTKEDAWKKYLILSQLDVDRLDYLRRDSLFTGAGYGHFDWHRLITTMEFRGDKPTEWEICWGDKAKFAIEEYIFARYYMYQNVYLHKTTRGFEQMLQAMWKRAKQIRTDGKDAAIVPSIADYWDAVDRAVLDPVHECGPSTQQYLRIEEFTVLGQIEAWRSHWDSGLSDLAARFLDRKPFAMIEEPEGRLALSQEPTEWELALEELIKKNQQYQPSWMYGLVDTVKSKYHQPYFPEKESDEQTVKNSIRIVTNGDPIEISELLPRLRPLTESGSPTKRYYVPQELRADAMNLRAKFVKKLSANKNAPPKPSQAPGVQQPGASRAAKKRRKKS